MTDTIQTPADTATDEATETVAAEEFLHLDPADIIIGTNVRNDLRPDHKEFRKSIKERGVLEAVTVYRNEDGQYVLLRGQRRTVTAAEVRRERAQRELDAKVDAATRADTRDLDAPLRLDGMRLVTWRGASRAEQGLSFGREAALARKFATDKGMQIGLDGVQLLGGHGFTKEHPVERWYRDLRGAGIGEGIVVL